jgi:hypothetical protein
VQVGCVTGPVGDNQATESWPRCCRFVIDCVGKLDTEIMAIDESHDVASTLVRCTCHSVDVLGKVLTSVSV